VTGSPASLSLRIRSARQTAGLTPRVLEQRAGLPAGRVAAFKAGDLDGVGARQLAAVAASLRVDTAALIPIWPWPAPPLQAIDAAHGPP